MNNIDRAVVLGPGGVVGTAWMIGLAAGLRQEGVDLADADLVVGTSAGAIVGALLTTGEDLARFAAPSDEDLRDSEGTPPAIDPAGMNEVFAILADPTLEPAEARRRAGRIGLTAATGPEDAHLARMGALVTAREWPERRLLITAVDAETGRPKVWDRAGEAPLLAAVASSCAMPGAFPPVTVNGRRYMDGGLRNGVNADLAADARVRIVVEPLAHLFPRTHEGEEVRIVPDRAAVDAFGPTLFERAAWQPCYEAGARQAKEAAKRICA